MIFVDTSYWVALRNQRDQRHEQAQTLIELHGDDQLVTTTQVRGETWTFLRRRAGHRSAVAFLDAIAASQRVQVAVVSAQDEEKAFRWLRQHDEREYSFVDATSFVVMAAMRIQRALAFDGDFAAAGFVELRA